MEVTGSFIEMTSWIATGISKKKIAPIPTSYFSYNEGTFVNRTPKLVVVSAIYELTSGLSDLLQKIPYPTILFTERTLADKLALFRKGLEDITRVVVLPRSEWVSTTRLLPNFWSQQVKQDPEIQLGRTAEDLQLLFERKDFMLKAVEMNPFGSTDFLWVHPSEFASLPTIETLNSSPKIPIDRILVANPEPFRADDIASSYFRGKQRVENGILIGSKQCWIDFAKLYDTVMIQKLKVGGFIGDDAVMLHYMIIHKPNQFCLVKDSSLSKILTSN